MKLSFHTSQRQSPGSTSLQLDIAYTDGLLNEKEISDACELAISAFVTHISKPIVVAASKERHRRVAEQAPLGDSVDQIIEQILCESPNLSAV